MAASKAVIYYSHNQGDKMLFQYCFRQLLVSSGEIPIIAVTHSSISGAFKNIVTGDLPYNLSSILYQMKLGLEATDADVVFLAEHDVLYPPGYFDVEPRLETVVCYQTYIYSINKQYCWRHPPQKILSQVVCWRKWLLQCVNRNLHALKQPGHCVAAEFKPPHFDVIGFANSLPSVDIRHGHNFTKMACDGEYCYDIPYWGDHKSIAKQLGLHDVAQGAMFKEGEFS